MEERIAYIQKMLALTPEQEARHKLEKQRWFTAMEPQRANQVVDCILACAGNIFDKLRTDFGLASAGEYAVGLGIAIQHSKEPPSEFFLHFALFQTPPPTIILTDSSMSMTEAYIQKKGLEPGFEGIGVGEFALAHELYHVMAEKYPELDIAAAIAARGIEIPTRRERGGAILLLGELVACRLSQLILDTDVTASALEAALTFAFRDDQEEMLRQNRKQRWQKAVDMFTKLRPNKED